LVEAIDVNLLYRWFVGLNIEDRARDHATFSVNRERLLNEGLVRSFFERVKATAQGKTSPTSASRAGRTRATTAKPLSRAAGA
jgi:transposase